MYIKDNQPLEAHKVLTHYRKATGQTQEALAKALNVQRQTVSMWESGKQTPSLQNWYNLIQILRIPEGLAKACWRNDE